MVRSKKFLSAVLGISMVLSLAACGGSSSTQSTTAAAAAPAATEAAKAETEAAKAETTAAAAEAKDLGGKGTRRNKVFINFIEAVIFT